jgi:hypothetical protein
MAYHKEKFYRRGVPKEITGVIIDGDDLRVCNRHQKKIFDLTAKLAEATDIPTIHRLHARLIGCLTAAGQIDKKVLDKRQKLDTFVKNKFDSLRNN